MIYSIQYMRAIAALMVVIHHAAIKSYQNGTDLLFGFQFGSAGVDLFFIISGFIMCYTVDGREFKIGKFLLARVKRIIPLYWFMTTLALLVFVFIPEKVNSSGGQTSILDSYFLLPLGSKFLIQNGWTLSYEFYFYFLFGCSLMLFRAFWVIPIVLLAACFPSFLFHFERNIFVFLFDTILLEFAMGVVCYMLYSRLKSTYSLGLFFFSLSLLSFYLLYFEFHIEPRVIHFGLPCMFFFLGMLCFESYFFRIQSSVLSRLFGRIGESSYSLYLVHPFALVACTIFFSKFMNIIKYESIYILCMLFASVVAGFLSYHFVEKNFSILINKFKL